MISALSLVRIFIHESGCMVNHHRRHDVLHIKRGKDLRLVPRSIVLLVAAERSPHAVSETRAW